jgi:type II restriction-modification system restriction subunit
MSLQADWSGGHWPVTSDNWQDYISELRLEIICGEAPFIVGRHNAASGKKVLKLSDRVGFLDRKLQIVSKYCKTKKIGLSGLLQLLNVLMVTSGKAIIYF